MSGTLVDVSSSPAASVASSPESAPGTSGSSSNSSSPTPVVGDVVGATDGPAQSKEEVGDTEPLHDPPSPFPPPPPPQQTRTFREFIMRYIYTQTWCSRFDAGRHSRVPCIALVTQDLAFRIVFGYVRPPCVDCWYIQFDISHFFFLYIL